MPNTHPARELLTTASFALITGVVPDTVRQWRRAGKVTPAFVTPSGIALYRREDADGIARQRKQERAGTAA
jgi:DNA-binding transcriptional MerR regulator